MDGINISDFVAKVINVGVKSELGKDVLNSTDSVITGLGRGVICDMLDDR